MKLYVVRHGETDANKNCVVLGRTDLPLNKTGLEQAADIALQLKEKGISKIFSSPMLRTRQTAEAVAELLHLPYTTDDRLIEQNYGIYEGTDWNDKGFQTTKRNFACHYPGGESHLQTACRVYSILDEIKEKYADDSILLVTHGGICRIIHSYFKDMTNETFFKFTTKNCECREYNL